MNPLPTRADRYPADRPLSDHEGTVQLADRFDEQRRQILALEDRLYRETQVLNADRERFAEDYLQKSKELAQARFELEAQQRQLEAAQTRFHQERTRAQADWKQHWTAEWTRLTQQAADIAAEQQAIAKQATTIELDRRKLEAGWSELRHEQQNWQTRQTKETSQLRQQEQALADRETALLEARETWDQQRQQQEADHIRLSDELDGLETRIRNHRRKLAQLQAETSQESGVRSQESGIRNRKSSGADSCPLTPDLLPSSITPIPLDLLASVVEDLDDELRWLAEQRQVMAKIRQSWQWEWEIALADLVLRDRDLDQRRESLVPREQAVAVSEKSLQQRSTDLDRFQRHLQCWEARLFKQQSIFQCQRRRLLAIVKSRLASANRRWQQANQLHERGEAERHKQLQRYLDERQAAEKAHEEYRNLRDRLRQQAGELSRRERALLEREIVLTQVEHELLGRDPQPAAADQALARRRRHWEKLAMRPVLALRRQQQEVAVQTRRLAAVRDRLIQQQHLYEQRYAECQRLHNDLERKHAALMLERARWQQEIQFLHDERGCLEGHARELQQEVDRLALILADDTPPMPALALAA